MAHFTPFIKASTNITQTLNQAAQDRKIKKSEVDFDLLEVETLTQLGESKEFTSIKEALEKTYDKSMLLNESLFVRQEYQIRIRPYEVDKKLGDVKLEVGSNKAKSKVVATFKKGSVFPCDINLAKLLKREINRKKLRLGLLIGHFEAGLNATLIKLAKAVKCGSPLSKDVKIVIAQSPGAFFAKNDSIILHYEKNEDTKKNLIDGVDSGVLIFEYVKPKIGRDGRSCSGEYITVPQPQIKYANYVPDKETVSIKEDEDSIKYYSKIDGYVKNSGGVISISREMTIKSASFRDTGSIETGENKDISINISNKNNLDDAVGSGVNIDVKELNVEGTIGSHAKVKANELNVGEQTHRNSQLEAVENAKVHLHRGNLKAKTAEIDILENGTIQADDVYVKKMLGGEIIGHRVVVDEITSNTIIIASESIEIKTISGHHNKLIIDPDKIESFHEKVEAFKKELKEKSYEFREINTEYEKKVSEHQGQLDRIKVFQKRILAASKTGKTPNKADVIRVRQYKSEAEKLSAESISIKAKEDEINVLSTELEKLYEAELHAKIIYKGAYDGQTKVMFVDLKTSKEYAVVPDGVCEKIVLVKDGVNGEDRKISW